MKHNDDEEHDPILLPMPVVVDFVRFEKNLLQIGFFGAHDIRHKSQSTRRIEQLVTRNGQKTKVSAEFRSSEALGLPSTSDRDKYIAFMKIAMEEKIRSGRISNPVRFSGYRLLKELGLTYSGENYEDINRWGQRMADTTITSEQVIYMASARRYVNKTLHVFRSFTRTGQSYLNGARRTEQYEVVLEDWLLENLNESYVIPQDFTTYRELRRPTAKGIFGYLHLWFHASRGRQIEKDYSELCVLLNIPAYKHLSKIRETMGKSLDELVEVRYLDTWDIRPMSTKEGFKLVLSSGAELLRVLGLSQPKLRQSDGESDSRAVDVLLKHGVAPSKAADLLKRFPPELIVDQTEYAEFLFARDRGKYDNPAGFLIYTIENQIPLPAGFITSRRRLQQQERQRARANQEKQLFEIRVSYDQWCETRVDQELSARYTDADLARKVKQLISQRVIRDERFRHIAPDHQEVIALQLLRKDLASEIGLPTFEEWSEQTGQQLTMFRS